MKVQIEPYGTCHHETELFDEMRSISAWFSMNYAVPNRSDEMLLKSVGRVLALSKDGIKIVMENNDRKEEHETNID